MAKAGYDILSAYSSGEAAKARAEMKAQLAEINAHAMERDAFETIKVGLAKKAHYLGKAQQVASSQNVAYAVADVDTSFGTAKQVKEESMLMGQLNAKDIENAAEQQAIGYKAKALQYRFTAGMDISAAEQGAKNLLMSSVIKAGTDIGKNWDRTTFSKKTAEPETYDSLIYDWSSDSSTSTNVASFSFDTPKLTY